MSPAGRTCAVACLLSLLGALPATKSWAQSDQEKVKREAIGKLISAVDYGVPESPAFELLPEQPSEVTNVITPKDFKSALSAWHDGSKLRTGLALDSRPLVKSGRSLKEYQSSWWRQAAFRTVLSAGTSAAMQGSTDVVFAGGIRIPLIDKGDPRADAKYNERLATLYDSALAKLGPPPLRAPFDTFVARAAKASVALEPVREEFRRSHWNALKLELGLAASLQASSGIVRRDSIQADRAGLWGALAVPVVRVGQLTIAGKTAWTRSDTSIAETNRSLLGARLRLYPSEQLSFSAEFARVWSDHSRDTSRNDRWNHLGAVFEWYVPELKGWLGLGYGGDTKRRDDTGDKLSLSYAIYHQRLLESSEK
ncbi:MAG TPA: hypothetical protein VH763_16630 [Gemmatimonadales bacterium]